MYISNFNIFINNYLYFYYNLLLFMYIYVYLLLQGNFVTLLPIE